MLSQRMLYAPNIHQGGGKTLLLPLLEALKDAEDVTFVLDARMPLPKGVRLAGKIYRVKPSLFSRLFFEWKLCSLIHQGVLVLCMGNLPPLFAHHGIQHIFIQNRYLIDDVWLSDFSLAVRFRLTVERWWLRTRTKYVKNFFVQTDTMRKILQINLDKRATLASLVPSVILEKKIRDNIANKRYDFIYVASGEPHKKHKELIYGWIALAKEGLFPNLCLTLDHEHFPSLCMWIQKMKKKYGLCIDMKGQLSYVQIQNLYMDTKAMIYPSTFESFGLPLLEGCAFSLPIITSDMDYVYDVIQPTATFNVKIPESIAEAVKSMSYAPVEIVLPLLNADEFIEHCFSCKSKEVDANLK